MKQSTAILLIILLTSVVYCNSLQNSFVWDDYMIIVKNGFVKSLSNFHKIFTSSYITKCSELKYLGTSNIGAGEGSYRPVVTATYFIDYFIWKLNAFGYHLSNLLLHICNAILLYLFTDLLVKNKKIALWCALLFALHPVNTEAVNSISFREDLLAFLFFISSFILYIKINGYKNKKKQWCYLASLFLFFIAVFSKEMAVTLPVLIILYDYIFVSEYNFKRVFKLYKVRYLGYSSILFYYLYVRFILFPSGPGFTATYLGGSANILSMVRVIAYYIKWFIMPTDIRIIWRQDTSFISHTLFTPITFFSIALLLLLLLYAFTIRRSSKELSFAIFWFFITLIPVSNLIPIGNFMAARYLYIPIVGFCLFMAVFLKKVLKWNKNIILKVNMQNLSRNIVVILLVLYGTGSIVKNFSWKNDVVFWSGMLANYPEQHNFHVNIGDSYVEMEDIDKAFIEYSIALEKDSDNAKAHYGLGICYEVAGRYQDAVDSYKKALELDVSLLYIYIKLGNRLVKMGLREEAKEVFEKAIEHDENFLAAYIGISNTSSDLGLYDQAEKILKKVIEKDPDYAPAYNNLGFIYVKTGRYAEAEKMWEKTILIDPNNKNAKINLSRLLQTQHK